MNSETAVHNYMTLLLKSQRTNSSASRKVKPVLLRAPFWGPHLGRHFRVSLAISTVEFYSSFQWDTHSICAYIVHTLPYLTKLRHGCLKERRATRHQRKLPQSSFFLIFLFVLLVIGTDIDFQALKNGRHIASCSAMFSICLKKNHSMTTFFPYKNMSN